MDTVVDFQQRGRSHSFAPNFQKMTKIDCFEQVVQEYSTRRCLIKFLFWTCILPVRGNHVDTEVDF